MKPTGNMRWIRRERDYERVLQQEMSGYGNEVWWDGHLVSSDNIFVTKWVDVIEVNERTSEPV